MNLAVTNILCVFYGHLTVDILGEGGGVKILRRKSQYEQPEIKPSTSFRCRHYDKLRKKKNNNVIILYRREKIH